MKKLSLIIIAFFFFTNAYSQGVGIGTNTPNPSSVLELKDTTKGFLPPRMTTAQRDAIVSPATGLTIYNTTSKGCEHFNGTNWCSIAHYIGETYGGGIVFFIYDNGQHGLIFYPYIYYGSYWGAAITTNAKRDGIGAGIYNTERIIITGNTGAAQLCGDLQYGNYGDWYLPSKYELNLIYLQNSNIFNSIDLFWSSTEYSSASAWAQNFFTGSQITSGKSNSYFYLAVRRF
jgi:hypothetical protein